VHTPRIDDELRERIRKINDFTDPQNLNRSLSTNALTTEEKQENKA
jgi:hypothetical protein